MLFQTDLSCDAWADEFRDGIYPVMAKDYPAEHILTIATKQ